jgi:hypothetical protein
VVRTRSLKVGFLEEGAFRLNLGQTQGAEEHSPNDSQWPKPFSLTTRELQWGNGEKSVELVGAPRTCLNPMQICPAQSGAGNPVVCRWWKIPAKS